MTTFLIRHPVIVVAVPCYNEEAYLTRTLESLRAQTLTDFAVLVTDNASTDDSGRIARAFCDRDSRFHYHRHEQNCGSAENFNSGRALSDSPYILWLGAHDLLAPDALRYHVAVLQARPEVAVSQSAHAWIDIEDKIVERISDGDLDWGKPDDPGRYLRSIGCNQNNIGANSAIRRAMLDDLWFTGIIGADRVLGSHLAYRGRYADTSEVLYFRRTFGERIFEERDEESYMKRLTGRADAAIDWSAMARAYHADFAGLLPDHVDARRLHRQLDFTLRYHLPVGAGTPLTSALWTLRRMRKWSAIVWTHIIGGRGLVDSQH